MRCNTLFTAWLMALIAMLLTACAAGDARQVNLVALRLLSAAATQTAVAAADAAQTEDPAVIDAQPTRGPSPTPLPPLVFARCIMRAGLAMRLRPDEGAPAVAVLKPRDIVTAYGRTEDSGWILAWNRDITYGWVPASSLGCSAPFEDLRPTASDVLLAPEPTETVGPIAPTEAVIAATATKPIATTPPPPSPIPSPTATPEPPVPGPTIIVRVITVTVIVTVTVPPIVIIATPTPVVARQLETRAPAPAPTITPIPDALTCVVTSERILNLRSRPDRSSRLVGRLQPGATFFATGRNTDQTWLNGLTSTGLRAWAIASAVSCQGDVSSLPVVE
jgi:hypothetical protein